MDAVVIISADTEWQTTLALFPDARLEHSPLGAWFLAPLEPRVVIFHGGWGKVAAAASAQYVLARWSPRLLVNLGTCGGFKGYVERGAVLLVERAIIYDIIEQMGDAAAAIAHYTTQLDLTWIGTEYPHPVLRDLIVSGDRDLIAAEVPALHARYGAVAGDWESGSIAWVAARNGVRCLILRGVSDLVGPEGGEAYDSNMDVFVTGAQRILAQLFAHLPTWLALGLD